MILAIISHLPVTLFQKGALLFAVASGITLASDSAVLIRSQESALATALNTRNEVVLSALIDNNFTVHWTAYSLERIVDTAESREAWLEHIRHSGLDSYDQSISNVQVPNPDQAIVMLDEHWTISLTDGRRIEKRFRTTDFWFRLEGTWKLTTRRLQTVRPLANV